MFDKINILSYNVFRYSDYSKKIHMSSEDRYKTPAEVLQELHTHATSEQTASGQEYIMLNEHESMPVSSVPDWAGRWVQGAELGVRILPKGTRAR